jgi:hypothetical protein
MHDGHEDTMITKEPTQGIFVTVVSFEFFVSIVVGFDHNRNL